MKQIPPRASTAEIQTRVPATSSMTSRAIAGTSRTLTPWMGVTIETSPISTPRNVNANPARNRVPTMAGCQSIDAGCVVLPVSVSAKNATAVVQVTTINMVQVEVPWAWARLSSSSAMTIRILEQNGSSRWMTGTPCRRGNGFLRVRLGRPESHARERRSVVGRDHCGNRSAGCGRFPASTAGSHESRRPSLGFRPAGNRLRR